MPNWVAVATLVVNLVILALAIAYQLLAIKQDFRSWRYWQLLIVFTLMAALSALFVVNVYLLWERLA